MNKNENRYFATAALFDEALIFLLEKKDIEYITVKEICRKAGVNRSTFYLHYESVDDLLEEAIDYINKKFVERFPEHPDNFTDLIPAAPAEELKLLNEKYLTPYLSFVKENKRIFNTALSFPHRMKSDKSYDNLKNFVLFPILEKFNVKESERPYLVAFYISGIVAVIKEWLSGGCKESIADIGQIIMRCVDGGR